MKKAVLFEEFSACCQFFDSDAAGGYGCKHKQQENGAEAARCFCWSCPLGIEAEQEDLTENGAIDWDGLCEDGEVAESEILIVCTGEEATEEQKEALENYEKYLRRYEKE